MHGELETLCCNLATRRLVGHKEEQRILSVMCLKAALIKKREGTWQALIVCVPAHGDKDETVQLQGYSVLIRGVGVAAKATFEQGEK